MEFLRERDLSHRISVNNDPSLEGEISNVVFERASWNRGRGAEDMTSLDLAKVRLDNFAEGVLACAHAASVAAARGAAVGALIELPVSTIENLLLVRCQGKTMRQASQQIVRDVGRSALVGAAGAAIFTGIAAIGLPVGKVAVPLAVVGGTLYTWSAAKRIWRAIGTVSGYGLASHSFA